jgi:Zn-dependent protease with chaperone function
LIGLIETAAAFAAVAFVLSWAFVSAFGRRVGGAASPGHRSVRAALWLYAPVWVPLIATAAALGAGLPATLLFGADHCAAHSSHHHHLCILHPPHASGLWAVATLSVTAAVPAVALFFRALAHVRRDEAIALSLSELSATSALGTDVRVLETDSPLAFTVGLRRPQVLVSVGMLNRASPDALKTVIAHERAHARRRDTLRAALDRAVATILPAASRHNLVREADLAREQLCDAEAARVMGGRPVVARALAEVISLGMGAPASGVSVGGSGTDLEQRVIALLYPGSASLRWLVRYCGVVAALVLIAAGPLHSVFEHALSSLLH